MMKKLRLSLIIAALSLGATGLLPVNAQAAFTPAHTFYAAGSSAMFNTFGLAAGLNNAAGPGNPAFCGQHHWSDKNGVQVLDGRGVGNPQKGNIWIVWDDDAKNQVAGSGTVCVYITVDSIVGVREYMSGATIQMLDAAGSITGLNNGGVDIVPYMTNPLAENLNANIWAEVNGAKINVGMTDIRPEDAFFGTLRVLTFPAGQRIPRDPYTGDGYGFLGDGGVGTQIYSSQSTAAADTIDFSIYTPDPITGLPPRRFAVIPVGANVEVVIANQQTAGLGHLGDGNYTNINRSSLANVFTGQITRINDISTNPAEATAPGAGFPIHVYQREPLSGTYSTFEFCAMLTQEQYVSYNAPVAIGQETGVNPANHANCTGGVFVPPCALENGNPFWHIAANGATRGMVIGTGEEVNAVNNHADSIGYTFWSFGNVANKANIKYLTVDGIDPLYASPAANPGGPGFLPQCTGGNPLCPIVPFPHLIDGSYPIWSYQRMMVDPTDPTVVATQLLVYANAAASSQVTDFVPVPSMTVFRSHFNQLVDDASDDVAPNNGFKAGFTEGGGDMGGLVLTIQSELDYINDTGGLQQINLKQ